MRILIACDKFKGSLDAAGACDAIATGLRDADATIEIDTCPLADGGEGTGELLAKHFGAISQAQEVRDPLQRPHTATWWWQNETKRAITEMAQASGLALLKKTEYAPLKTTTYGTGELIAAALDRGATEILVTVGGSATIDGGIGALQALGWKFFDEDDNILPISGGVALSQVARVVPPNTKPSAKLTILADVRNPLCGPDGAASVYGPQKGATADDVKALDAGLAYFAAKLREFLTVSDFDAHKSPHFGASGGLPLGLAAAFDAKIRDGFSVVATACDFQRRMSTCDLCITGEGKLDEQSLQGKVTGEVARIATAEKKPCVAIVGVCDADFSRTPAASTHFARILPLSSTETVTEADLANTAANLTHTAREFARDDCNVSQ